MASPLFTAKTTLMLYKYKHLTYIALAFLALTFTACNESGDDVEETSLVNQNDEIVALDGKVTTLQTATKGNGYNIILMGDGFTVDLIKNGTYDEVMKKSAEHLFALEPMKSLRPYFNVYVVQKVSLSSDLSGSTALASTIKNGKVCGFINDDNLDYKTMLYASTVPGYKEENSVISVVMNTTKQAALHSGAVGVLHCLVPIPRSTAVWMAHTSATPSYTKRLDMLSASSTTNTTCRTSTSTMPAASVSPTDTLWDG